VLVLAIRAVLETHVTCRNQVKGAVAAHPSINKRLSEGQRLLVWMEFDITEAAVIAIERGSQKFKVMSSLSWVVGCEVLLATPWL
jgi:hypothetical protein